MLKSLSTQRDLQYPIEMQTSGVSTSAALSSAPGVMADSHLLEATFFASSAAAVSLANMAYSSADLGQLIACSMGCVTGNYIFLEMSNKRPRECELPVGSSGGGDPNPHCFSEAEFGVCLRPVHTAAHVHSLRALLSPNIEFEALA